MRKTAIATAAGRGRREMANHGHHVQGEVRVWSLYDRAHVRLLHRDQRTGLVVHAKLEPAEGVPGEPETGRRDLFRSGEPRHERKLHRPGGHRPGTGGRHDDMENVCAEQHTVDTDSVCGVVERPEPEAQAGHGHTRRR